VGPASFLRELREQRGEAEVAVAENIIAWARKRGFGLTWGSGKSYGSFIPVLDHGGDSYGPIVVWTSGAINIQLERLRTKGTFKAKGKRVDFIRRLNKVPGVEISDAAIDRMPPVALAALVDDSALRTFLNALDWFAHEVSAHKPRHKP